MNDFQSNTFKINKTWKKLLTYSTRDNRGLNLTWTICEELTDNCIYPTNK